MDQSSDRDAQRENPPTTATLRAQPSEVETLAASPEALRRLFARPTPPSAPGLGSDAPVVHPPDTHMGTPRPSALETMAAPPRPSTVGTMVAGPSLDDTVAFLGAPETSTTGTLLRGSPSASAHTRTPGDVSTPAALRNGARPIEAPEGLDRNLALARLQERMLGVEPAAVKIGRFIVIRKLGQGAMGIVYLAFDPKLDRKVALKLVDTSALGSEVGDAQVRLEREAKAAAALGHPNVVTVYDVGEHGDDVFLAMEYVEGTCLTAWMKEEHGWREVVTLFIEVARGLAAAHDAKLVHRDFKPDNVLMGEDGRPRVADFGLARPTEGWSARDAARMLSGGTDASARPLAIRSQDALASTGEVCGTPAYMAPEQFAGLDVDAASDQFGFCASLFEALFGYRPFKGDSVTELAVAVMENDRQPLPPDHGVPKAVVEVLLQGLEPKAADRHPSMQALADRLDHALRARTRNRMVAGGALLATFGIGFGVQASQAMQERPCEAAAAEIDGTWNAERHASAQRALEAAGLDDELLGNLDAFAQRWTVQRVESCEATHVEGTQSEEVLDLRMACLDRAASRLSVTADALESGATPKTLAAVPSALGGVEECENVAQLKEKQDLLGFGHDDLEQQVAWNETEKDHAFLMLHAHDAPSVWEPVAIGLTRTGLEHALPQAAAVGLRWQGKAALVRGEVEQAEAFLDQALPYSAASLNRRLTPEILGALGETGLMLDRLDVAAERLRLAEAMAARIEDGDVRREDIERFRLTLAEVEIRKGTPENAVEIVRAMLETEGERSPHVQERLHSTLGSACWAMHDTGCAFEHHAKAMEIVAGLPDLEPLELAGRHANMGLMYAEAGDGPHAVDELGKAADIVERAFDADHPMRGQLLSDRGGIQGAMMDPKDGERDLLAGLAIHEKNHGKDHPALVEALIDLTKTQLQLGKPVEAKKHGEWAVRIVDGAFEPDHPRRADPRLPLSEAYAATGQFDDAAKVLREGLDVLEGPKTHPMQRAEFQFALARALAPLDAEAAREAAMAAKAGIADFEPGKPLRDAIDGWSAQVLDAPAQPAL